MKIITQDYGCGTSSSIIDYNIEDVVIVDPNNYEHVFDIQDDLFFVGHDFLLFLWDTKEKVERWKANNFKKIVWCFERVDAIIPIWKQKSEFSIYMLQKFIDQIYVCDEDDAKLYGDWMPQWASPIFYQMKDTPILKNNFLFSGQAGKPEYTARTKLLSEIFLDTEVKSKFDVTNISRTLVWEEYCKNLLSYPGVINPVGVLKAFNTRTYEVLYSGRLLLQQTIGSYNRHEKLIEDNKNVVLFQDFKDLKSKLSKIDLNDLNRESNLFFEKNNIFARFKEIGVELK